MQQSLDCRVTEARKALAHIISIDAGTNTDFVTLVSQCTIAAVEGTADDIALLEEVRTALSDLTKHLLVRAGNADARVAKLRMVLVLCNTALEHFRDTQRSEEENAEYRLLDTLARKGNMPLDALAVELAVAEPVTEKLIKPHMDAEFVRINSEGWYMITPLGRRRRSELKQELGIE
jgi:hypothetical protein